MSLIDVNGLGMHYGSRDVFAGINLRLAAGGRYALVGSNGAGKSTLARLLAGLEEPSAGRVRRSPSCRVAYVPQQIGFPDDLTVLDALTTDFQTLREDLRQAEKLLARSGNGAADASSTRRPTENAVHGDEPSATPTSDSVTLERAMDIYQRARDAWDAVDGDHLDARADALLDALGLPGKTSEPVNTLSGGERGLVALAAALLGNPDLLILDEPGNHLDYAGLAWLEAFLDRFEGTLLVISHNRYLMDRLCGTVFELASGRLTTYEGNYSDYRLVKLRELASAQADHKAKIRHVDRLEELVRRFEQIARVTADPAWGKRLRARRTQLEKAREEAGEPPDDDRIRIGVTLGGEKSKAEIALRVTDYHKAFGDLVLFAGASMEVRGGERVGIIGPNGSGKTTLIREIIEKGSWDDDVLRVGPSFVVGYLAQKPEGFDDALTIEEEIRGWGALTRDQAFALAAPLAFGWEDLTKTVGSLSGGEINRLQLAKLAFRKANFLILDEPTNHLDTASREAVEDALAEFDGTLLVVSHDRYFLDKVVNRIVEIRDHRLIPFSGGFSAWWKKRGGRETSAGRTTSRGAERNRKRGGKHDEKQGRKPRTHDAAPTDLERRIDASEKEKLTLEAAITRAFEKGDHVAGRELSVKLNALNPRIQELYEKWAE